ncbi:MAG: serine protease [Acidobacteria bacterium]|nr:serine protease [Acidobacteriota bacterium]
MDEAFPPGSLPARLGVLACLWALLVPGAPAPAAAEARRTVDPLQVGHYQKTPVGTDETSPSLEQGLGAVCRLRTQITYDLDGEPLRSELEGTGVIVEVGGRKLILSLAHVVGEDLTAEPGWRGAAAWRTKGRQQATRTWIDLPGGEVEIDLVHRDPRSDLAFFSLPEEITAPALPFPVGESDRLRIGDFVYLLGRLEGTDLHVRSGIVSALSPTARIAELPFAQHVFMISAPLSAGDSGSPVLAVRGGRYELVGIAQGKYATAREAGWVVRIETILSALREFMPGGPVSASR